MGDGMGVSRIAQIFLPFFAGAIPGAIKIGGDGGDPMTVRAVAGRATTDVNDPHPLRHKIFGADLFLAPIDLFIFHSLARAAGDNESGPACGQDLKTPS
jgi:hypothetical protein